MADKRSDKFSWKKGDVEIEVSQCADCVNNTGLGECAVYAVKPQQFAGNKEQCPDHEQE